ncbi:putative 3'-N-debenzoyl-2'-deoxytaxol N-benzoyltransferase [Tripterygium wilfordii]|uniref:Putative 3'-N-debenzoyl-2'-deoxytaxol N-benzoyltransferase n=1 Tax=Tripterygium wilfordii TaxID=458696 RepID=A0A7J7CES4_TRIWF|nr:putative 3'-N-debenzoyl-2'-deoxytaxol N-benzoyltransferase [Tripterygium wilfordii]
MVTKRFMFHDTKIAALRARVKQSGTYIEEPTCYEAVTSLLWGAFIHALGNADDFRRRMNPPLKPICTGNNANTTMSLWPAKTKVDYNCLAGRIREAVRKVDQNHTEVLGATTLRAEEMSQSLAGVMSFFCSSWLYPFYESDFGWGKPVWIAVVPLFNNSIILLNTSDGEGVEAWVALCKEDMSMFEENHDILAFASQI